MSDVPINFDWIKARAACCLETVFHTLREVIDSDVKSANKLRLRGFEFGINAATANQIIVSRKKDFGGGIVEGESVVFELKPNEIQVRNGRTEKHLLSAKPELSAGGECFLKVEGEAEPQRFWQFSKKALENFFFG